MAAEIVDRDWEDFKTKFNNKSQIDLNQYKPAQMQRRIGNLMARHNVGRYLDFFQLLERDETLYRYFIDYLTINVTEFFRTPEKFVELERKIIPELIQQSQRLKIWSAAVRPERSPTRFRFCSVRLRHGSDIRFWPPIWMGKCWRKPKMEFTRQMN